MNKLYQLCGFVVENKIWERLLGAKHSPQAFFKGGFGRLEIIFKRKTFSTKRGVIILTS